MISLLVAVVLSLASLVQAAEVSDAEIEQLRQTADKLQQVSRQLMGELRYPQNDREWRELDAAARQGPAACYRWLGSNQDAAIQKGLQGKTWSDVGETDPVAGCRKIAEKVGQVVRRGKEATAVGHLSELRSAMAVYYGDHEGVYPARLGDLVPKYIAALPSLELPDHPGDSRKVKITPTLKSDDAGGWGYTVTADHTEAQVFINCTHTRHSGSDKDKPLYSL